MRDLVLDRIDLPLGLAALAILVAPQHTVREPHPTIWCDALSRPCSEGYSPVSNDVLLLVPFAVLELRALLTGLPLVEPTLRAGSVHYRIAQL